MDKPSFNSSRAKIVRAREQLHTLERKIDRFCKSKSYTIKKERDLQTGEDLMIFHATKPIPLKWSIIIGEIIHDLRSALDHAIYELTILNRGEALSGTEFPIFEDEDKALNQQGTIAGMRRPYRFPTRSPAAMASKAAGSSPPSRHTAMPPRPYFSTNPSRARTLSPSAYHTVWRCPASSL